MYVIVAGAGLIGYEISVQLVENKHDVVVIEKDIKVCESLYTETGALVINGDATDLKNLKKAGADTADVILCLMRIPADNIACALLSKSLKIPRIIARMREAHYEDAYRLAGVTTIVRLSDLVVHQILVEIEQPKVRKIVSLGSGKAEIYAVKIPAESKCSGKSIKNITQNKNFPKNCNFIGVFKEKEDDFLIPRGDYVLCKDDTIFLVAPSLNIKQATDFLGI